MYTHYLFAFASNITDWDLFEKLIIAQLFKLPTWIGTQGFFSSQESATGLYLESDESSTNQTAIPLFSHLCLYPKFSQSFAFILQILY
jgi:hypothetical protein